MIAAFKLAGDYKKGIIQRFKALCRRDDKFEAITTSRISAERGITAFS